MSSFLNLFFGLGIIIRDNLFRPQIYLINPIPSRVFFILLILLDDNEIRVLNLQLIFELLNFKGGISQETRTQGGAM
jgi:hypothetical protein